MEMNFLSKDLIMRDHRKFAKAIAERLKAVTTVLEEPTEDGYKFGYTINKNRNEFKVSTPFVGNERGEFAQKELDWTVEVGTSRASGFSTLGDVFKYIRFKCI